MVRSGKGNSQSTAADREANLGVSGSHLVPPGRPSSWFGHLSKISRKEWNPCQAGGRSVAVDVDPNTQKSFFSKIFNFIREVTPGSPSPRKPHIKVGSLSNTAPLNQQPMGVTILAHFGPFWPQPDNTPAHSAPTRDQGRHSGPQAAFGPLDVGCISHTAPLS